MASYTEKQPIRELSEGEQADWCERCQKIRDQLNLGDKIPRIPWDFGVRYGDKRNGHGLLLTMWSNISKNMDDWNYEDIKDEAIQVDINIHGPYAGALPAGFGFIARQFLPISTRAVVHWKQNPKKKKEFYQVQTIDVGTEAKHATIMDAVKKLYEGADPVLAITVERQEWSQIYFAILPFKPSDIINKVDKGDLIKADVKSVFYHGDDISSLKPPNMVLKKLRWLMLPLIFLIACWCLIQNPEPILARVSPLWSTEHQKTFLSLLLPTPQTKVQAFELGKMVQRFQDAVGQKVKDGILTEASHLLNTGERVLTAAEFTGLLAETARLEEYQGLLSRLWGFMNFVNIMWFMAIIGLTISVGPFVYLITKPLQAFLSNFLTWFAKVVRKFLVEKVWPQVVRCHNWGVFEVLTYYFSFRIVCQGVLMPDPSTGQMIALTGVIFAIFGWGYSTLLWSTGGGKPRSFVNVTELFFALTLMPFVSYFESELLAWAFILPLYEMTTWGTMFMNFGRCESYIHQSFIVSSAIMVATVATKLVYGDDFPTYLVPFRTILCIFGTILFGFWGFFECLLEMDNTLKSDGNFLRKRVVNIGINLLHFAIIGIGLTYGQPGIANVSIVYLLWNFWFYLFTWEWVGTWGFVFTLSLFIYKGALWLHTNPEFVIDMFR